MTQAKADQDFVTNTVAELIKRFGIDSIIVALHTAANKHNIGSESDYTALTYKMEELEHELNFMSIDKLRKPSF